MISKRRWVWKKGFRSALPFYFMKLSPNFALAAAVLAVSLPINAQTPGSGVDLNAIDKGVSPCANFYQYACGTWMKNNPLPSDQSRWTRFNELATKNLEIERKILEQVQTPNPARTAVQQKIEDYYAACMDEAAVERKGVTPLKPMLDQIDALKTRDQLTAEVIRLHRAGIRAFFALRAQPDEKNAERYIATVSQGGVTMPDRDYYLNDNAKTAAIRKQFREHVRKMFELLDQGLGRTSDDAAKKADAVLAIETALAKNSLDRVALRNPDNTYHIMTLQQLADVTPDFAWRDYLGKIGMPPVTSLNVAEPDFFRCLAGIFSATSLEDLKTYLTWHALHDSLTLSDRRSSITAGVLPKSFEDESWNFDSHILNGVPQQEARWEALRSNRPTDCWGRRWAQEFVKVAFSAASKDKTLQMVKEIEEMGG